MHKKFCHGTCLHVLLGLAEDVEEYWFRLRRLNWKRLVMKEREDEKCESHKQVCYDKLPILPRPCQYFFALFKTSLIKTAFLMCNVRVFMNLINPLTIYNKTIEFVLIKCPRFLKLSL